MDERWYLTLYTHIKGPSSDLNLPPGGQSDTLKRMREACLSPWLTVSQEANQEEGVISVQKTRGADTCLSNEGEMTLEISKSFTINAEQLSVAFKQSSDGIYKRF